MKFPMNTKDKIKDYAGTALMIVFVVALLWVAVSGFIQRFKCPKMTETELFLHIPKSFVCRWHHCD